MRKVIRKFEGGGGEGAWANGWLPFVCFYIFCGSCVVDVGDRDKGPKNFFWTSRKRVSSIGRPASFVSASSRAVLPISLFQKKHRFDQWESTWSLFGLWGFLYYVFFMIFDHFRSFPFGSRTVNARAEKEG
jgi:hypothetical protein